MAVYQMTPTQVLTLSKSKFHYYLFLVILISKKRILRSDLKNKFKEISTLDLVVNDLLRSNLFIEEQLFITCVNFDVKFPSDVSAEIAADQDLDSEFTHIQIIMNKGEIKL